MSSLTSATSPLTRPFTLPAWAAVLTLAGALGQPLSAVAADDAAATLQRELQLVSKQRIYFGHQSVGENIMAGLTTLSGSAGVPLKMVEYRTGAEVPAATLGHTFVAENTQPLKKIKSFEQAMATPAPNLNIAVLKFCYVDFDPNTDVKALFDQYKGAIQRIQTANPQLKVVHVTAPLTTVASGWKASLKGLLGKAPFGLLENQKREEYNTLIRQTYGTTGLVFDIAKLEARQADGKTLTFDLKGQAIPALVPQYSDDGGHLNASGQLLAAREFISVLAKAARKDKE